MKICIPYQPSASGGPSTFYRNLTNALTTQGIAVTGTLTADCAAMLVIIYAHPRLLWQARRLGIPIVQRLDGVHYSAENRLTRWRLNLPIWINYHFFSNHIIFQSEYSHRQCHHFLGKHQAIEHIIYNGVDTHVFKPEGDKYVIGNGRTILSLLSSYKRAFELETVINAYDLLKKQAPDVEMAIIGQVDTQFENLVNDRPDIKWLGTVPHNQLPDLFRAASLVLSAKLRQNCPNAILEAIASGVPIACYNSGAHYELLADEAGICVPLPEDGFGSFPPLDATTLAQAAQDIFRDEATYRVNARQRAIHHFALEKMVNKYVTVLQATMQQQ